MNLANPCRACGGAHHIQRCPDISHLLFADPPVVWDPGPEGPDTPRPGDDDLDRCPGCGDIAIGICAACQEWDHEPIGVQRARWAIEATIPNAYGVVVPF